MRVSLKQFILTISLVFVLLFQLACGLAGRVAKAVGAIPSVVRVLYPNADVVLLATLDGAAAVFKEFVENKTASNWERAENAWNNGAKPALLRLNNTRVNQIVAAVDILIGQVTVPSGNFADSPNAPVKTNFKEDDVKRLEELVK